MIKILCGIVLSLFMIYETGFARVEITEEQKETSHEKKAEKTSHKKNAKEKKHTKEEEKKRKENEKEEKRQAKEAKRLAKEEEQAIKKAEKEQEKKEKNAKKNAEKYVKTNKKHTKKPASIKKHPKKVTKKDKQDTKRHEKVLRKKVKNDEIKESREEHHEHLVEADNSFYHNHRAKIHAQREERSNGIINWRNAQHKKLAADEAAGKYAYLFSVPASTITEQWFENKHQLNVTAFYNYATGCYDSSGASSKKDITQLAFGENQIKLQDILLASKLVANKQLIQKDPLVALLPVVIAAAAINTARPSDNYLGYFSQEAVTFNGRVEQYGANVGFSKMLMNRKIAIGFDMPVLHKKHHITSTLAMTDLAIKPGGLINDGALGPVNNMANPANILVADAGDIKRQFLQNAFSKRYASDPSRLLADVLQAKGFDEIGGSASGIGDIVLFANSQVNSPIAEKIVFGLKCSLPTGKKASTKKLWGPELGNGGCTTLGLYGTTLINHNKYINVHITSECSFALPAHVDKRVPTQVSLPSKTVVDVAARTVVANELKNTIVFGDRTVRAKADSTALAANNDQIVAISTFDTTVRGFGDQVTRVKVTRGTEFKFRIGNMIEQFITRQGFLDIFYDFKAKTKDSVSGQPRDIYNLAILREHTDEISHQIGAEYSYQADLDTRLRFGSRYTFAGMNTPKTFEITGSLNYSF